MIKIGISVKLGGLDLKSVSGGQLWLDGGTMFGVVPKVLWQCKSSSDDRNRILLETNCLLVSTGDKTVLIDTGYGSKASDRQRENHAMQDGLPLLDNLSSLGLGPDDVDMVILTHLHFDHAGGCTFIDETKKLRPTFPRACYVIQRSEWEDATGDLPELVGSYYQRDFVPLEEAGLLELIDGDVQLLPGIGTRVTGGHTRGHQMITLDGGDQRALYLGDICPLTAHLPTFWAMAYDQYPLTLRRVKPMILGEAADNDWLVLFDHDPEIKSAYLKRDDKRQFAVRDPIAL